jgi:hypothetical protein
MNRHASLAEQMHQNHYGGVQDKYLNLYITQFPLNFESETPSFLMKTESSVSASYYYRQTAQAQQWDKKS